MVCNNIYSYEILKLIEGHIQYMHYISSCTIVKYRKKALVNTEIIDFLKQKIHEISETFEVSTKHRMWINHFHMIFIAKLTLNIPKYLNSIKTIYLT
jgi:putative transposase